MRPVRLARIAAEAEAVRWHAFAVRTAVRLVCVVVALLFVVGALTIGHIAAWYALRVDFGVEFYWSALALGGFDLAVALILLLIASRSGPGRVERDAVEVRQQAVAGILSTLNLVQIAVSLARILGGRRRP